MPTAQQQPIVQVVDLILALKRYFQSHPQQHTARDTMQLEFLENVNDALVRQLYMPEEIRARNLDFPALVKGARLPGVTTIRNIAEVLDVRSSLERAADINSPLRAALFELWLA